MTITAEAALAFRDYETDGVPGSGPHKVVKSDVRTLFSDLDAFMATVAANTRTRLTADTTFYVDGTLGSDANNGLTPGAGAWQTIQKGIDSICNNYDLVRKNVVLQVADGTYTQPLSLYNVTGWGTIGGHSELILRGNLTTPGNCVISVVNSNCFSSVGLTTPWRIEGFRMIATGAPGNAVACDGGSFVYVGKNEFGACTEAHMSASFFSFLELVDSYAIVGGAKYHFVAFTSALVDAALSTVTLTGTPNFSQVFAAAFVGSAIEAETMTFVGGATGARYVATANATINVGGTGVNYFPGNAVGSVSNGGQYN